MRRQNDSDERRYRRIAEQLRTEIANGTHPLGGKLPSERTLTDRFGVARPTVRHALDVLRTEGLIEPRQRSGLYVRSTIPLPPRVLRRTGRDATGEAAGSDSAPIHSEIRTFQEPATERVAAALGLEQGAQTVVRRCLVSSPERPLHLAATYTPAMAPASSEVIDPVNGPVSERIKVRTPTNEEADQLALRIGTPVIELTRAIPQARAFTIVVLASDAYELLYEWP